ncbi:synaptonemal complex protein 2-like isoform X1 [Silurus meridionalis]|nr:synaptonemal complex protein 2-like isoform X1 [Silurus meridionalis]
MVQWFEKARKLWVAAGPSRNEPLINLAEDYFDALMVIHKSCKEDYDLQVALMEALCRMTSRAQRRELADQWFSIELVASAFTKIQDSEFETLLMPVDENLQEFWIDFNLGSQSISFYFCLADDEAKQESQWDTLCITENEVQSYTLEEEQGVKVLHLVLTEPVCLSSIEGTRLTIHFSSSLDILNATKKVYGETKNKHLSVEKVVEMVQADPELQEEPLEPPEQLFVVQTSSGGLSYKQFHAQLTQRLERVLKECEQQEQNPPEFSAAGKEAEPGRRTQRQNQTKLCTTEQSGWAKAIKADMSHNRPTGRNVKKHLFSDTDTDNMTDISWTNSANRRPKPKVADYTRQPVKAARLPVAITCMSFA